MTGLNYGLTIYGLKHEPLPLDVHSKCLQYTNLSQIQASYYMYKSSVHKSFLDIWEVHSTYLKFRSPIKCTCRVLKLP